MEITIKGELKEIADLVTTLQDRRLTDPQSLSDSILVSNLRIFGKLPEVGSA